MGCCESMEQESPLIYRKPLDIKTINFSAEDSSSSTYTSELFRHNKRNNDQKVHTYAVHTRAKHEDHSYEPTQKSDFMTGKYNDDSSSSQDAGKSQYNVIEELTKSSDENQ